MRQLLFHKLSELFICLQSTLLPSFVEVPTEVTTPSLDVRVDTLSILIDVSNNSGTSCKT